MRAATGWSWRNSVLALVFLPPLAFADFASAYQAFLDGDYEVAHHAFLDLAELGDGASQYNLGAMSWQGQGTRRDPVTALGWMLAATQNGFEVDPAMLEKVRSAVDPDELPRAQAIVARYGREKIEKTLLPGPDDPPGWRKAQAVFIEKPRNFGRADGMVIVEYTVATDGLARDPQIFASVPVGQFDNVVVEAVLKGRFEPARLNGEPVESRAFFAFKFVSARAYSVAWTPWKPVARGAAGSAPRGIIRLFIAGSVPPRIEEWAYVRNRFWEVLAYYESTGQPLARYIVGAAAYAEDNLGIASAEAVRMIVSAAQSGDPIAQYWVGSYFQKRGCFAGKAEPWLKRAARILAGAKVLLARRLLCDPTPEAVAQAREWLLTVGHSPHPYALKHATALLAASPHDALRDSEVALELAKRLNSREFDTDPQSKEAVAAAMAANGRFKRAVTEQHNALRRARRLSWNTALMEERLAAYREHRVWRGDLFAVPPANDLPAPKESSANAANPESRNVEPTETDD